MSSDSSSIVEIDLRSDNIPLLFTTVCFLGLVCW